MRKLLKENIGAITIFIIALINILIIISGNFKCPWNESLQIYCAGCGGTRMLYSILRLEFYQAFRYNPFIFMLIVFFMMRGIVSIIRYRKVKPLSNKIILLLLILTILFVILRNIPIFSFLAPTVL